jgi:hypothetical protein
MRFESCAVSFLNASTDNESAVEVWRVASKREIDDFVAWSRRPSAWVFGARAHLAVSEVLFDRAHSLHMGRGAQHKSHQDVEELAGCWQAAYLHAGLSVEQAAKAVLISRDHKIITDTGRIDRQRFPSAGPSGHAVSGIVPQLISALSPREVEILQKLEDHIIWKGKYAVPLNVEQLEVTDVRVRGAAHYLDDRATIRSIVERLLAMVPT